MNAISVTDAAQIFRCEFCSRDFQRETTLFAHMCEPKRRYRERDEVGVKIGLAAYLRFYEITQGSARLKTWQDFAGSAYYRAFVRFGRHCQSIRAINVPAFADWLIRGNAKLDHWCRDQLYADYLLEHVRRENVGDALARAVVTAQEWSDHTGNPVADYLRYGNDNRICHDTTRGRVTAWTIYNCASGQEFLTRINPEQLAMTWCWIDADIWQRRFQDYPADQAYAQEILRQAGW
jgi:hypothetical protein